jgi:hypothetical protein
MSESGIIKTSELLSNGGEIRQLTKEIEALIDTTEKLRDIEINTAKALAVSVRKSSPANESGREGISEAAKKADAITKALERYNTALDDNQVKLEAVKAAEAEIKKLNKLSAKEQLAKAGSLNQVRAALALNAQAQAQLTREELKSTKNGQKLVAQQKELTVQLEQYRAEKTKINRIAKAEAKINAAVDDSYDALSGQYTLNKIALNDMSDEMRLNTEEGQKLEKSTLAIFKQMTKLQERTGKHTLSVGDYTKGLRNAASEQKKLVKELDETTEAFKIARKQGNLSAEDLAKYEEGVIELNEQIESLGAITGKSADQVRKGNQSMGASFDGLIPGLDSVKKAFGLLAKTPLLAIVVVLVTVFGALFSAFTKSKTGAELLAKVGGALEGVMSLLVKVAEQLAILLIDVWEDPIGSLEKLRDAIRDNVTNRIEGLIKLFPALAKAIKAAFNPLEDATEAGKEVLSVLAQIGTGLDEQDQLEFAAAAKAVAEELARQALAFADLATAKREQRRANRGLQTSIEKLTTAQQLAQAQADDDTKSFAEREAASKRAGKALEELAATEIKLTKGNLALLNQELDLRRSNDEDVEDLLDQQTNAYRQVIAAERELLLRRQDNAAKGAKIEQDRLERDLDILIDGFDNQKTINERKLQDERTTQEQRLALLAETTQLANDTFRKQIETVQLTTDAQVDANSLLAESDAVVLNQRIRSLGLSEIIEGRLLEIIRERRTAIQDLSEAQKDLAERARTTATEELSAANQLASARFNAETRTAEEIAEFNLKTKRDELESIQALNEQFAGTLKAVDTRSAQAEIITLERDLAKARIETGLDLLDQKQALAESDFNLLERTERQKTAFAKTAEIERLEEVLRLNAEYGGELTELQVQTIRNQIAAAKKELTLPREINSIFDVFGFDLKDGELNAFRTVANEIKGAIIEIADARAAAADAAVAATQKTLDASKEALQVEIQNRKAGFDDEVETAKRQFIEDQRRNQAALREQRAAQKAQARIQTAEQTVNLITSSAQIWKSFSGLGPAGPFLAGAAIAGMWTSFAASKVRANQVAKEEFKDGGYVEIKGGSHRSGNDTPLGFRVNGKEAYAERGESHAIFTQATRRKYGRELRDVVNKLQRGTFQNHYASLDGLHVDEEGVTVLNTPNNGPAPPDLSNIERDIAAIRRSAEQRTSYSPDGKRRQKGNVTTKYA